MFISRIRLSREPSAASLLKMMGAGVGTYENHRLLWSLFGDDPDRRRDFIFRADWKDGRPEFLAVSQREPEDRHNLFEIEAKPYAPDLRPGDRLRLIGRVNPVVRKDAGGKRKKVDVVMDELRRRKQAASPDLDRLSAARAAVGAWLAEQGERHGFRLLGAEVSAYDVGSFRTAAGHPARVAGVDLTAAVEVADPEAMTALLFAGIGASRAFGYGLLLPRRI